MKKESKVRFFDSNAFIGIPNLKKIYSPVAKCSEIIEQMDSSGIEKALIWHIVQYDSSPEYGNDILAEEISMSERLSGTWTLLPPQTGEVVKGDFFGEMKKAKILGLRVFPESHRFVFNKVSFGGLLEEISERNIPLFFSIEKGTSWNTIFGIMADFPFLTCIVSDLGAWSPLRNILPLMDAYPNFYVETSMLGLHEGNIEFIVKRDGAERLLFGTGFPEKYIEASMLALLHAEISYEEKEKIASGNMERIISKVKL